MLCISRSCEGEEILGVFNFSEYNKEVSLCSVTGEYMDMLTGDDVSPAKIPLPAYGFCYMAGKQK